MANETRAHIALVTGDLITSDGAIRWSIVWTGWRDCAPMPACSAAWAITRSTRVPRITWNATARGAGMRFLRQQTASLRFGNAR